MPGTPRSPRPALIVPRVSWKPRQGEPGEGGDGQQRAAGAADGADTGEVGEQTAQQQADQAHGLPDQVEGAEYPAGTSAGPTPVGSSVRLTRSTSTYWPESSPGDTSVISGCQSGDSRWVGVARASATCVISIISS